jgi:hypothetical protein
LSGQRHLRGGCGDRGALVPVAPSDGEHRERRRANRSAVLFTGVSENGHDCKGDLIDRASRARGCAVRLRCSRMRHSKVWNFGFVGLSDADRVQLGDESATQCLAYTFAVTAAAGDNEVLDQNIEGVRRTADKVVTISLSPSHPSSTAI